MSGGRGIAVALAAGLAVAGVTLALLALTAGIGAEDGGAAPGRTMAGEPEGGRALFARMGCATCHTLAAAGSTGEFGPDLDGRLGSHTAASLEATILDPPGPGGYSGMPEDFGERMSDAELDTLVSFLLASRAGRSER